ncbi:MAG: hypothetical protein AB7U73_03360 [Pirellulales bacterium]
MSLDPYSLCPAGTGKKLKFCCADLMGELEKIQRMLGGDQRLASLEYVDKLDAKYPGRACLLAVKLQLERELGRQEERAATLKRFLELHPQNPVALAASALDVIAHDGAVAGTRRLHEALAASPGEMPQEVYRAIGDVAAALWIGGNPAAALVHWMMQLAIDPQDQEVGNLVTRLVREPSVPLLLRSTPKLPAQPPAGVAWAEKFTDGLKLYNQGRWFQALDVFNALAQQDPEAADLWRCVGSLRTALAENAAAAEAWRELSALDIPRDDAIEAEALAQLLAPAGDAPKLEWVRIEYPVDEVETLEAALTADKQSLKASAQPRTPDAPPPRAAFLLIDRPLPEEVDGLTPETLPNRLASIEVYGRETDRTARLEMEVRRDHLAAAQEVLSRAAGNTLGTAGEPVVLAEQSAIEAALRGDQMIPAGVSRDQAERLQRETRRYNLLERWTRVSQPALDGKSPLDTVGDRRYGRKLAALVLNLELAELSSPGGSNAAELRRVLGLAEPEALDPRGLKIEELPAARMPRLPWAKLSTDQLVDAWHYVTAYGLSQLVERAGSELLGRQDLDGKLDELEVLRELAEAAPSSDAALEYIDRARNVATKRKQSTVAFDLDELALRLERMEPDAAMKLIEHIARDHGREPGVDAALTRVLLNAGAITPDGRIMLRAPAGTKATQPSIITPDAAGGAEPGKIWTPDGDSGAAGERRPAIWTPGSD